jgi:hypothetical protein
MGACKSKEKNRSKIDFQSNDYRPEPTGGRADRIRGASENGSVKVSI